MQTPATEKNAAEKNTQIKSTSMIDKDTKKRERQIRRAVEEIEVNMGALAETIATFEEQLCDPAIYSDHEKTLSIQSELNEVKQQHEELEMEWLELNDELEQL